MAFITVRFLRYFNFLSIDAVLIALTWQGDFARTVDVTLTWQERTFLGISVWIVYILDHLLDASRQFKSLLKAESFDCSAPTSTSSFNFNCCEAARHHFARRHRTLLLGGLFIAMLVDLTLAFTFSPPMLLAGCALGLLTFFYLLINAVLLRYGIWPRGREIIVALIFSLGCALMPLMHAAAPIDLLPSITAFALLGMINCILIARMERTVPLALLAENLIPSPRWIGFFALLFFLMKNYYNISLVATALVISLCGLSLIPTIAKRYSYEIASLATDGALFVGAFFSLLM